MNRKTAPSWLFLPIVIASVFLLIPFAAMLLRVSWSNLPSLLTSQEALDALWLSIKTCLASTVACMILGVPLAIWLADAPDTWFPRAMRTLVTLPMVLPPVVAGLALLIAWGRTGVVGEYLDIMGIQIGFTTLAVIMAQTFVSMPFLITSLEGALRTRGFDYEEAAYGLGSSRTRTLFLVTLPLSAPAIVSSTALAFSRCLGEFGATITFAGSLQGVTRTMPLEIYLQRETDTDTAIALSLVLLAIAFLTVGGASALAKWWGAYVQHRNPAGRRGAAKDALEEQEEHRPCDNARHNDALPHEHQANPPHIRVCAAIEERGVDVDLSFEPASTTALIGPNGAGKSTIVSLIAGRLEADSGGVEFSRTASECATEGIDTPPDGNGEDSYRPRIVLLAQKPALFPHMTVLNNVLFGLKCQGVSGKKGIETAQARLEELGVGHLSQRYPQQLSGGQARRVALARALAIDPDVMLLDEPFAALDIEVAEQLRSILPHHVKGITTVLVTHDLADVKALDCDVVVMGHGHIRRRGYWKDIVTADNDPFVGTLAQKLVMSALFKD